MVRLPSRLQPTEPAEFLDGISDGSFWTEKGDQENYRQFESPARSGPPRTCRVKRRSRLELGGAAEARNCAGTLDASARGRRSRSRRRRSPPGGAPPPASDGRPRPAGAPPPWPASGRSPRG